MMRLSSACRVTTPIPAIPCQPGELLILAVAAAFDAQGRALAPAQALVRVGDAAAPWRVELLALASSACAFPRNARHVDASRCVLLPAFVNAHTHLDLSHVAPVPFDAQAGFMSFVRYVLSHRASRPEATIANVRRGVALSLAGGVVAVGDICGVVDGLAGSVAPSAVVASGLAGVAFIEALGFGPASAGSIAALRDAVRVAVPNDRMRVGVSPHAPYSTSRAIFDACVETGLPLCTHVAENPEEREFIARGTGAYRAMHERAGWWEDATLREVGQGRSPVAQVRSVLDRARPALLAHCNDLSDDDLRTLRESGACVAYCPRSSEYFENQRHFGPHRYRELLAAGVPVALGTDSVVNLPVWCSSGPAARISTLDEARRLFERDATDPRTLLAMMTTHGARALGLSENEFTLSEGVKAGLVLVRSDTPDLVGVLRGDAAPVLIARPD